MAISNELWGASRTTRLSSARSLTSEELNAIHGDLRRGRTAQGWPYGSATSINPLLVILGRSPGNSPQPGDSHFVARTPFDPPTAGMPHPGVWYPDRRRYWNKVRVLARTLLDADGALGDRDVLALFGTMNLSTAAFGRAGRGQIDESFARWVLATIRDGLRPRVLALLGLRTRLKEQVLSRLFQDVFKGLNLGSPKRKYALEVDPTYAFREWDLAAPDGSPLLLVDWPQHSGKPPFVGSEGHNWRAACDQFTEQLRNRDPSLIE